VKRRAAYVRDFLDETPLHKASQAGAVEIMKLPIDGGADASATTEPRRDGARTSAAQETRSDPGSLAFVRDRTGPGRRMTRRLGVSLALLLLAVVACSTKGGEALDVAIDEPFEIRAQLRGRPFMFGQICCELDLHVGSEREASLSARVIEPETWKRKVIRRSFVVSPEDRARLRMTVAASGFFGLPPRLRANGAMHPIVRIVTVDAGGRSHRVVVASGAECDDLHRAMEVDPDHVRRACEVWRAVRSLVTEPAVTVP
jgi:hypothetical protein